jgi:translocation protein SEC62
LSIALLAFIGGIAVLAVIRLILFVITMFALPPGIWLFPNLFEDVGFFESFVPLWAWERVKKKRRKVAKAEGTTEVKAVKAPVSDTVKRSLHPTVEDAPDNEE